MREALYRGPKTSSFSVNQAVSLLAHVGICRRQRHLRTHWSRKRLPGIALCRQKVVPPAGIEPAIRDRSSGAVGLSRLF